MIPEIIARPLGDNPPTATLWYGVHVFDGLRGLEDNSVHCVVTSPPYWGLRSYGVVPQQWGGVLSCAHQWHPQSTTRKGSTNGRPTSTLESGPSRKTVGVGDSNNHGSTNQYRKDLSYSCLHCDGWLGDLGLEPSPSMYVEHLVQVFREVKRVLRDEGTLWLNLGDSYSSTNLEGDRIKKKDLVGIPWRVALALQEDGWYLRSDIIWNKLNPLPESVSDRPSKSHEYLFLFSKQSSYYYDAIAIREPVATPKVSSNEDTNAEIHDNGRNKRSVWSMTTKPYGGRHFASFPPSLVSPCVLAGTSGKGCCAICGTPWQRVVERNTLAVTRHEVQPNHRSGGLTVEQRWERSGLSHFAHNEWLKENPPKTIRWEPGCACTEKTLIPCTVLDPFSGSGTCGQVALDHGRKYIGIDLNLEYLPMAKARILNEPVFSSDTEDDMGVLSLFE